MSERGFRCRPVRIRSPDTDGLRVSMVQKRSKAESVLAFGWKAVYLGLRMGDLTTRQDLNRFFAALCRTMDQILFLAENGEND